MRVDENNIITVVCERERERERERHTDTHTPTQTETQTQTQTQTDRKRARQRDERKREESKCACIYQALSALATNQTFLQTNKIIAWQCIGFPRRLGRST